MMALDMAAVFILIVISCSGFFVAFSLSFGGDGGYDANSVAYQVSFHLRFPLYSQYMYVNWVVSYSDWICQ